MIINLKNQRSKFSIKELIKSPVFLQNKQFETKKYLEFNQKKKYIVKNKKKYLQYGFNDNQLQVEKITPNQHQPGENLRAKSEYDNAKYFQYDDQLKIYLKDIIEVGPSDRLTKNAIARIAISPKIHATDFEKHNRITNKEVVMLDIKFEQFYQQYKEMLDKWDVIYNFTDVLYYVDLKTEYFQDKEDIMAVGCMHIFKYNGSLRFDQEFGNINKVNNQIQMYVYGNTGVYEHESKYEELLKKEMILLDNKENRFLYIKKLFEYDCGSTNYIRFVIIQTHLQLQIRPSMYVDNDDNVEIKIIGADNYSVYVINYKELATKYLIDNQYLDRARSIYARKQLNSVSQLIIELIKEEFNLPIEELVIISKAVLQDMKMINDLK